MSADPPSTDAALNAGRRATDANDLVNKISPKLMPGQRTASATSPPSMSDSEVETIDMDAALPPGSAAISDTVPRVPLTPEQRKHRLELAAFKKSFVDFDLIENQTCITIQDIKRGDVIRIKTIVGSLFIRVVDRTRKNKNGAGTMLCECHYDLGDQCTLAHAAYIDLPICSKAHNFTHADGSTRPASRQLKMGSETPLPPHVSKVLDERFFADLEIYANPQPEKFRPIDLWRVIARVFGKIKALIDENNRREREKKQQKEEARRQKKAAKQAAREAKKNKS